MRKDAVIRGKCRFAASSWVPMHFPVRSCVYCTKLAQASARQAQYFKSLRNESRRCLQFLDGRNTGSLEDGQRIEGDNRSSVGMLSRSRIVRELTNGIGKAPLHTLASDLGLPTMQIDPVSLQGWTVSILEDLHALCSAYDIASQRIAIYLLPPLSAICFQIICWTAFLLCRH